MAADMLKVLHLATGINNQKKRILGPAGNNQIVHHTALLIGQCGVGLLVDAEGFQIDWHQFFQSLSGPFPFNDNLPHMGHIKQTCIVSAVQVFLHNTAAVLHWHQVASKGHHFAAGSKVAIIEYGFRNIRICRHKPHSLQSEKSNAPR